MTNLWLGTALVIELAICIIVSMGDPNRKFSTHVLTAVLAAIPSLLWPIILFMFVMGAFLSAIVLGNFIKEERR